MNISIENWLAQSDLPKNEARLLLQYATGLTRAQLITKNKNLLKNNQLITLNQLAHRRLSGEPLAYILGQREFYGRSFAVSPAVLIPRPETEHLLELALQKLPENGTLWDLGTGSGILAITAKLERPDLHVFASDISTQALAIAKQNAHHLGAKVTFGHGWWFQAAVDFDLPQNSVDALIANPPYIEQHDVHLQQGDLRFEPTSALTDFADGLSHIREITEKSVDFLKENGWLMFEHGYNQSSAVRQIFMQFGFANVATITDLAGLERVSFGQFQAA